MRGEGTDEPVVAKKSGNAGRAKGLDGQADDAGRPAMGGADV